MLGGYKNQNSNFSLSILQKQQFLRSPRTGCFCFQTVYELMKKSVLCDITTWSYSWTLLTDLSWMWSRGTEKGCYPMRRLPPKPPLQEPVPSLPARPQHRLHCCLPADRQLFEASNESLGFLCEICDWIFIAVSCNFWILKGMFEIYFILKCFHRSKFTNKLFSGAPLLITAELAGRT